MLSDAFSDHNLQQTKHSEPGWDPGEKVGALGMHREPSSRRLNALVRWHLQKSEGQALHVASAPTDATTLTMGALDFHPQSDQQP